MMVINLFLTFFYSWHDTVDWTCRS